MGMEISQHAAPAIADYYNQIKDSIEGHMISVDTGYFMAHNASIVRVDVRTCKVTYRLNDADSELLREKIEESVR
jgi:hypothetical protein